MANNNRPHGPAMYDPQMWERAGIDWKTGLPKCATEWDYELKKNVKIQLRIKDEQDAVNRFKWGNIPLALSSQEIEKMLYHRQNLIFFYMEQLDEFFIMPYAFDDGLDFYGRPIYVHPVPYASGATDSEKAAIKRQADYLRTIKLKVIYDVVTEKDILKDGVVDEAKAKRLLNASCVIIRDYTPQFNENGIPRVQMQDSLLDVMADCIPFSRTAALNSTGVQAIGVHSKDENAAVYGFSNTVNNAALAGKKYVPITAGSIEFQELTGGAVAKSQDFLQLMQGYNNFRLSLYGLDNNGIYDKKEYVNNEQSGVSNAGLSLKDGLDNRQHACNIINSIWGINFWCTLPEEVKNNQSSDQEYDEDTTGESESEGEDNGME